MKLTHCKLTRKSQLKLLEFFALEATARSAADFLDIQPNSAMLFYKKIRQVISHHLALQAHEIFDGAVELDESYFGGARKGKRGRGAAGKNHIHINGIENFWNQAKRVLRKYNGIPKESFPLFLKECEFRFNCGTPKEQLKILKEWDLVLIYFSP